PRSELRSKREARRCEFRLIWPIYPRSRGTGRRFSRPVHSTTLPPLRGRLKPLPGPEALPPLYMQRRPRRHLGKVEGWIRVKIARWYRHFNVAPTLAGRDRSRRLSIRQYGQDKPCLCFSTPSMSRRISSLSQTERIIDSSYRRHRSERC